MDSNPIATPDRFAIRGNHIHASIHHPFQPFMVDA
jgi:hypothetical protein